MKVKFSFQILLVIAIAAVIFLPPFIKYQGMYRRSKKLERQISALKKEVEKLEKEKERLQTDITYVEKKAREKIGVAKKGEIILKNPPAAR